MVGHHLHLLVGEEVAVAEGQVVTQQPCVQHRRHRRAAGKNALPEVQVDPDPELAGGAAALDRLDGLDAAMLLPGHGQPFTAGRMPPSGRPCQAGLR
jgi:hypothetical protein